MLVLANVRYRPHSTAFPTVSQSNPRAFRLLFQAGRDGYHGFIVSIGRPTTHPKQAASTHVVPVKPRILSSSPSCFTDTMGQIEFADSESLVCAAE